MRQVINRSRLLFAVAAMLLLSPQLLFAQNSITALDVSDTGIIKVEFAQPLTHLPNGFALDNPPRIALDFVDTENKLGKALQNFTEGDLHSARIVEAGKRTRLVLNLNRKLAYNTRIEGGKLLIALQGNAVTAAAPSVPAALSSPGASSASSATPAVVADAAPANSEAEPTVLRFDISGYVLEGATLLKPSEISAAVAPYVGKNKDFSDVQRALEAIEDLYAKHGFSAVRVLLPEQELEKGDIRLRVVESRFGNVTVEGNQHVSEANVLNALPSLRSGGIPKSRQIGRELKSANENPARELNVVLKAGEKDDEVDAKVTVKDSKPSMWGVTADNTGTPETGRSRLGVFYRHANVFDADHVANLQFQMSPEHADRVKVLGAGYKIPFYQSGTSLEFFGGYSNVNSVVGGLDNFKGGGLIFSARYNFPSAKLGVFDSRLSAGMDWRDFRRIEQTSSPPTVLYNEIVVSPLSLAYAAQGKFARSQADLNLLLSANVPAMHKGKEADFAAYDRVNFVTPDSHYKVARYGASYSWMMGGDWQFRAVLNGQYSNNTLIQGEQFRLGGSDAVRGFTEGSEGGERGQRLNLEGYTPDFGKGDFKARGLVFFDAGRAQGSNGVKSSISAAGIGLRFNFGEQISLRTDAARRIDDGNDPSQRSGGWRAHASLSATF